MQTTQFNPSRASQPARYARPGGDRVPSRSSSPLATGDVAVTRTRPDLGPCRSRGRYPARMAIAQLILSSGRDVDLVRLEVSAGGTFLEGYPSARWNDMQLAALARNIAERYPHAGTYVIDPPRTRSDLPVTPAGPFGLVEMLPLVQCIGRVRVPSSQPGRRPGARTLGARRGLVSGRAGASIRRRHSAFPRGSRLGRPGPRRRSVAMVLCRTPLGGGPSWRGLRG